MRSQLVTLAARRPRRRRTTGLVLAGVVGLVLALVLGACSSSSPSSNGGSPSTGGGATATTRAPATANAALAAEAYVWGQPLVISMRTAQSFAGLFGTNHLYDQTDLSTPASRLVVAPNVDTLYSVAVLDLRQGPQVLTVPAITDRYYTYQFLDLYTESFAYVGTRATGGRAGSWLVVPPGWTGTAPAGDTVVRASTPIVVMLGRFLVSGPSDLPAARSVMASVHLTPGPGAGGSASAGSSGSTSSGGSTSGSSLGAPVGTAQTVARSGASFFDELGDDLAISPPTSAADRAELARLAPLGVGPGRHPAADGTAAQRAVLASGVAAGAARVAAGAGSTGHPLAANGWSGQLDVGRYGADFGLRAVVAQSGWGANIPAEAVYLHAERDDTGQPVSGAHAYVIHFPAGQLPPAQAFWSITLYGPDRFLVANAVNRYAIGDRTPGLARNPDGSLDVYVSASPPAGHTGNWLPAPAGAFSLTLRIYLPQASVLSGAYHPPALHRIG